MSVVVISMIAVQLFYQKKLHVKQMQQADEQMASLEQKLIQSNAEKTMRAQEIE
jgi:signal transduction histidine kinase